jgi:hypothetical protein
MTKAQFDAATKMAKEGTYGDVDDTILDGCGLPDFKPVTVSIDAAARFIAWQCLCLNGQFDQEALNEMREISRRKWLVCA